MKLIKYSLALAGLFYISIILPGLICILLGFNGIWASSGISLAIVCLLKGKIAKKIFGPNTTHHSSPNTAFFLIAISLISGVIKAVTFYANKKSMEGLGFTYEYTREDVFNQIYLPFLIVSLFLAVLLGIITFIRGKLKKHQTQQLLSPTEPVSNIDQKVIENEQLIQNESKPNVLTAEEVINKPSKNENNQQKDSTNTYKQWWSEISIFLGRYKIYILAVLTIIAVIFLFLKKCSTQNCIGEYLYVDTSGNIHGDKNCNLISSVGVERIELDELVYDDFNNCCHICISDEIYTNLKERHKKRVIERRINNIYDILRKYNISNIQAHKSNFKTWLDSDLDNMSYLFKILTLMKVKGLGDNISDFESWLYSEDESNIEISTAIQRLYDTCIRENLGVGNFNQFLKCMQYNEESRQWLYDKLVELRYDMESYQSFNETMTALVPYENLNHIEK